MTLSLEHDAFRAGLSDRELDLARRMGRGQCPKAIAHELGVHRSRVYQRIQALTHKLRVTPEDLARFGEALVAEESPKFV
jgi:DNA-binding NarL/FixJ family response regulator